MVFHFFHSRNLFIRYFFTNFCKSGSGSALKKQLDPNLHCAKQLDLDPGPQQMNADTQP